MSRVLRGETLIHEDVTEVGAAPRTLDLCSFPVGIRYSSTASGISSSKEGQPHLASNLSSDR